ncbi:TPA: hypothetical protein DDW69_03890 [candidate division CPR2 bacterium]|uniref:Uncharacterized protein n=1 Tax=candidate division CPR2 bacterium GW2011_GWC1_41_48 TaxID=1618344 RepID=A0A0G0Z7F4_UNCC2|nr:MAG: hypothetical protein UT47_C0003G0034 [candidate division CPR2 bacterium GW2011_GWC2_39_35]KKR28608.1 MAG: hypothetical protein UT60_C0016G0008 [candidate division CPR2 bacterium GW2011_GWD2_39_7]KKS08973.1 MAG: hypothetical protein UU65_C0003G0028 [candidate division CPR2 bacterium GW2011_GWC1_41_48]OGB72922.1 MAG: hypothetical protein A2Y26_00040 [candidate division CPR2 bacterium GWD2_39_7]HBG81951.1 hypothetical protein [candidate division CPR2 bacterium]
MNKSLSNLENAQASSPLIASVGQMIPSLLVFFAFFYAVNFAIFVLYLKFVVKGKIVWPAVVGVVGASAVAAFISIFLSFLVFSNVVFTFILTFAIIGLADFALIKYLLKLREKQNIGLSTALAFLANPVLWLVIIS